MGRKQRRFWTWTRLALGPSLSLLVAFGLVIGLNSENGPGLMASAIKAATGGRVQITGLGGSLPFAPRIERLVLADAEGPWLRIDQAALSLAPRALLNVELEIQSLSADAVEVLRTPASSNGSGSAWLLSLAIQLQHLEIGTLQLSGVLENAPDLALRGSAALARDGNLQANLAITLSDANLALQAELDAQLDQSWVRSEIRVTGMKAPGLAGDFTVRATGPVAALELTADGRLQLAQLAADNAIQLRGSGQLQAFERQLWLSTASLDLHGQGLRLLEPARIDFSDGLSIDAPAVQLFAPSATQTQQANGQLGISGRLVPALALDARVIDLPLATLIALLPSTVPLPDPLRGMTGLIALETRLDGTVSAPLGRLDLLAREVRWPDGMGRSLPPGELRLALQFGATATTIEALALVGTRASLELTGQLGDLALRACGQIDTSLFNPLLSAAGRQLEGQISLDLGIGGRLAQPKLDGLLELAHGAWRDRRLGLVLTEIDGALRLADETLRVERLSASAGPGDIQLSGTLGWLAPDQPIDLALSARKASPFQLDQRHLQADADLRLRGALARGSELSGRVQFERIDLRIPDRLPVTVARLEVKEVGVRRQPRTHRQRSQWANGNQDAGWSPASIGLDLLISAPRALTLTGRGIDAELGGEINARGSLAEPAIIGDFRLLRGDYALVGQQLRFTRGRIGFDGASVLDPTLDLEARVQAAGATAILAVEGTARAPEIRLSGEPDMPEDEVLSRLLFGLSQSRLSALQVARLGLAAASLAGIDGLGIGLLERTRSGLGLDRLRLGQETDVTGTRSRESILEGGRYLNERVYLGARQGARSGETQGVLRMQVSPRIRLETDVGADSGARAGAAFELEY